MHKLAWWLALFLLFSASADAHLPPYKRSDWRHWVDADDDCQDTRTEVLIAESLGPVTFADANQCRVVAGRWIDVYSGLEYSSPAELDVDHVVPLEWAHRHGGFAWSKGVRQLYANDLDDPQHLVAVHRSLNRSKGSKGPDAWVPPASACGYGRAWRGVIERWGLLLTWREFVALQQLLQECPSW